MQFFGSSGRIFSPIATKLGKNVQKCKLHLLAKNRSDRAKTAAAMDKKPQFSTKLTITLLLTITGPLFCFKR